MDLPQEIKRRSWTVRDQATGSGQGGGARKPMGRAGVE